jgi:hypothetical protein
LINFIVEKAIMEKNATFVADPNMVLARERGVGLAESTEAWPEPSVGMDQESEAEKGFVDAVKAQIALVRERHSGDGVCQTVWGCQLDAVDSFPAYLSLFEHQEANCRIYAVDLAGRCCGYLVSETRRAQLRDKLASLLKDNTPNDYAYGVREDEDDSLYTVARAAAVAIVALDCAVSPQETPPMSHGICEPVRSEW